MLKITGREVIEALIVGKVASITGISPEKFSADDPIIGLGIDSVGAVELVESIEEETGFELDPEELLDDLSTRDIVSRILNETKKPEPTLKLISAPTDTQAINSVQAQKKLDVSLFYFASDAGETCASFQFLLDSAKIADTGGLKALWFPERHFNRFGGIFPNPSVVAAYLAAHTKNIRLRAGSVVLPLHDPIRVAEEWSIVDQVSGGRVDLGFARGWNQNDFVLSPKNYESDIDILAHGFNEFGALWAGNAIQRKNGEGKVVEIRSYPRALQSKLNAWLTCTSGEERFVQAGHFGMNVLTGLLFQTIDELAEKVEKYRRAREEVGLDPRTGKVTVMLHTYMHEEKEVAIDTAEEPLKNYLKDSIALWRDKWEKLSQMSEGNIERVIDYAFKRYVTENALIGNAETFYQMTAKLERIGINEIAALVDFGVPNGLALKGIEMLCSCHEPDQKEVSSQEAV